MGDSDFTTPGPIELKFGTVTSNTQSHVPKCLNAALGVYGVGRGEIATSRDF